jgi:hypothetical protein
MLPLTDSMRGREEKGRDEHVDSESEGCRDFGRVDVRQACATHPHYASPLLYPHTCADGAYEESYDSTRLGRFLEQMQSILACILIISIGFGERNDTSDGHGGAASRGSLGRRLRRASVWNRWPVLAGILKSSLVGRNRLIYDRCLQASRRYFLRRRIEILGGVASEGRRSRAESDMARHWYAIGSK